MAAIEAIPVAKNESFSQIDTSNLESCQLNVLIKRCSTVYAHHTFAIGQNAPSGEIMSSLHQISQNGRLNLILKSLAQVLMMRRIAISTARIPSVSETHPKTNNTLLTISKPLPGDLESQEWHQLVQIADTERDDFLTQAFRKPSLLRNNTNLSQLLQRHDALTISYVFDRTAAWLWTFVAILISLVASIIYSVAAKDFNTGLAIGTAVLAVLLAIQGLLVFLGR